MATYGCSFPLALYAYKQGWATPRPLESGTIGMERILKMKKCVTRQEIDPQNDTTLIPLSFPLRCVLVAVSAHAYTSAPLQGQAAMRR